jgi:hypothetical protein
MTASPDTPMAPGVAAGIAATGRVAASAKAEAASPIDRNLFIKPPF